MNKIKNEQLRSFFAELRFTPSKGKLKQLENARAFLPAVNPSRQYPLDFICFKLTDYRPRQPMTGEPVPGEQLTQGLKLFIRQLSRHLAPKTENQPHLVYSTEQLAKRFSISTKTVQRWQKKGLLAAFYTFPDGSKKLGFSEPDLNIFIDNNPDLVKRASAFTKITDREHEKIIALIRELSARSFSSRAELICRVSEKTGRSVETIRQIITDFQDKNPNQPLLKNYTPPLAAKERSQIYRLYSQGWKIKDLCRKFSKSRSTIYRVINRRKLKTLTEQRIDYIDSPDFLDPDADNKILPTGWEQTLNNLQSGQNPVLSRDRETELFRRFNYLKHLASLTLTKASKANPRGNTLKRIQSCLDAAEKIKRVIIEANMGLVVSIARKHAGTKDPVSELVSDGSVTLIKAVEKFDYTRGYRFSTYASWAIAKEFARSIPARSARRSPAAMNIDDLQKDLRLPFIPDVEAIEQAHHNLEAIIDNNLNERERYIIRSHFGLEKTGPRKIKKSLAQIGDHLGLSKERVRQVELEAIQKLRHSMSPEEFDLLTG